ncbi:MAG: ribosomal protein S18-alanine N-acetyltransferase [Hyphomonadaceae bacterium]
MSARILSAGPEAAALFAALHAAAFPEPWTDDAFVNLLRAPGAFGLVLEQEGPMGMLVGWAAADEAEILTLAVTPEARRRGYGRGLVRAAMAEAGRRGARALFLEVAADNAPALALYGVLGFRPAGLRRNYYRRAAGAGADALVLRLGLADSPSALDLPPRRP